MLLKPLYSVCTDSWEKAFCEILLTLIEPLLPSKVYWAVNFVHLIQNQYKIDETRVIWEKEERSHVRGQPRLTISCHKLILPSKMLLLIALAERWTLSIWSKISTKSKNHAWCGRKKSVTKEDNHDLQYLPKLILPQIPPCSGGEPTIRALDTTSLDTFHDASIAEAV